MRDSGQKSGRCEAGGRTSSREWRQIVLGDVADIQTGPFGSQLHAADYVPVGVPSIMPTNLGSRLDIDTRDIACIREFDAARLARYRVQAGDVVYSRRGDVEKCAYVTQKEGGWLCGTGCLRIRFTSDAVLPRFCAYLFTTDEIKGWVSGNAVGTTMPNLNSAILERMPLVLPPFTEQQAIAAVLGSLDDKIDLLHRQNRTLEAMAETLFRQWFIEAAPQPSPRPSPRGRGGKTDACVIADLVEFNPLRRLSKGSVAPYLEMSSVSNATFNPDTWYDRPFSSGTKFINGDTLIARITPCLENGKTAFVTFLDQDQVGWGSTEFIVMRPRSGLHPFFAYVLARNQDFRDFAEGCLAGSSGRQRVETSHLKNYPFGLPSHQAIAKFNSMSEAVMPKLHLNFMQIRTLEKLRDNLLPKLMSGEVRVEV